MKKFFRRALTAIFIVAFMISASVACAEDAETYYNRGVDYYNQKQYESAIQDYNKTIELNPNYTLAYNNRGVAYLSLRNFNQAIADATKAIQLNPNYAKSYQLRGLCYQALGETAKAQADFAKAKELGFNG